jgi:hypothetical protein
MLSAKGLIKIYVPFVDEADAGYADHHSADKAPFGARNGVVHQQFVKSELVENNQRTDRR